MIFMVFYDGDFFGSYPKEYFENWMTWLIPIDGIQVYSVKVEG